ncbi:MAG TPA: serine hydrolase domain-containing protein [Polyangiales bacterium]|nr:serine hydrolase domain-containing protein [Polyangiales bacterium]
MTREFSKERLERMHAMLAGHVARKVPGLVSLVSRRGEVHVDVIGRSAIDGPPMQRDTMFRISSMTKPVIAAAAMILIEECKLRLDDAVDQFLPELSGRRVLKRLDASLEETVPANRAISVRDLLTFRMGFGQIMAHPDKYPITKAANALHIGLGPPDPANIPAPDEWMRRLGTLPLMYQPGERWMYNTSADLLGVLIARVSGRSLELFLRERLFEPLGMKDTSFSVPAAKLDRLATSYWNDPKSGELAVFDAADGSSAWSKPPAFPSGGGGLCSTIDDFAAFGQMMLDYGKHGRERVLSRAAVELMTTDHLTPEQKACSALVPGSFDAVGWGFGMAVVTRRDDVFNVGTFSWDGGMGTSWAADPRARFTGILLTQRMWASPVPPEVCRDFWTSSYAALED